MSYSSEIQWRVSYCNYTKLQKNDILTKITNFTDEDIKQKDSLHVVNVDMFRH